MKEAHLAISARRNSLIRAAEAGHEEEFMNGVRAASVDDLEWLAERLEARLGDKPYSTIDRILSAELDRTSSQLAIVRDTLDSKRTVERSQEKREKRSADRIALAVSIISVLISLAALIVSITVLNRPSP